jgi:3-hydroxy-9,10-secoandrosta-1,3,5(10)-triene-9,17-dione monooxygenase
MTIATPEVTPDELLERARALRPLLTERAAETEALRRPPEDLHQAVDDAGFYRLLMPRRYGGIETDIATYAQIWIEMARGDMSAGWCMCLMANHALQVGSWFPEHAQDEIFGADGSFRAPAVIFPLSEPARRTADGWELNGTVAYCSGAPYCTHYLGQALDTEGQPLVFVAPRSAFEVLDDWGDLIGLKGSSASSPARQAPRPGTRSRPRSTATPARARRARASVSSGSSATWRPAGGTSRRRTTRSSRASWRARTSG